MFRTPRERKVVLGLLLMVVTLALYNPVARNGFVNFDDDRYVTDNPQVRAGVHWSTISWAFNSFDQANWHPLTWLSHALDCQLFRLNPAGHHYTNLLLHAINALLLFLILQWFTGYTARSLMVAALFAVHPLNVESVAWVAERKNVLCMLFFLLALAAYGSYVRRPGVMRYLLVALLFAMGLMSKPMVITLPFVLLLLDYWPLRRFAWGQPPSSVTAESGSAAACGHSDSMLSGALATQPPWRLCLEKLPLLALSAGSAVITMVAQRAGGAVLTSAAHSPLLRLENVLISYVLYINKSVWPSHLAALYPYPHALPAWQVAASAVFLLAVTCAVLKYGEHRYLVVGWFWYLGTMLPMIGLVQVGNQAMADRYVYLPLIGLFIIIVWGTAEWAGSRQLSAKYLAAAGLTILLALCAVTRIQISYWHDDYSLWARALAVTQGNFVAENNLAHALIKQGRYDEAIVHFRAAAALEPGDPVSQLNLGIYAEEHGDLRQAAARYGYVLRLATESQIRASAYTNLGTIYFAIHDYAQAQRNFDSAMKLKPVFPAALLDMGLIAQNAADWNRAADYFAQFVAVSPSDVGYLLLAHALHQAGRHDDADRAYQQALRLSNDINQAQQRAAQLAAQ
ncbi:MAG TPA: tetratricopeptide repeat protein [Terriglobales bacterium]|nr:tetratricopeptide repeat protein [Terriglobales bacterium]